MKLFKSGKGNNNRSILDQIKTSQQSNVTFIFARFLFLDNV